MNSILGGTIGLFTGMSLLSLIELLYWIVVWMGDFLSMPITRVVG